MARHFRRAFSFHHNTTIMKKAFIVTFQISVRVKTEVSDGYSSTEPISDADWNKITSDAVEVVDTSDLSGNVSDITEDENEDSND